MSFGFGFGFPRGGSAAAARSPSSLFTSGVAGAWYDPSDTSTLFQDSAGTTPVTAVEQPVGLMLDKSQGLVLGSELVPDYDFATPASWTPETADWVVSGGKATYTKPGAGVQYLQSNDNISIVSGTWYKVTYTISGIAASNNAIFGLFNKTASTNYLGGYQTITANGTYSIYFLATSSTTGIRIYGNAGSTSASWSFESFGIKSLAGNHALQATAASRPVLRARYNLLTYSEQFDNAAWVLSAATVTANSTTAPDGTTTADTITFSSVAGRVQRAINMASQCISIYAKPIVGTRFAINTDGVSGADATIFNLSGSGSVVSTGANNNSSVITALADGWYRIVTARGSTAGTNIYLGALNSGGGSADSFYIWGAQLVTGSSAGTYQRIAAATDYATAGFLPYLAFDGTDDTMQSNTITFSTKYMTCVTGDSRTNNAAQRILLELSANSSVNNGSFGVYSPFATNGSYGWQRDNTVTSDNITTGGYTTLTPYVGTGIIDFTADPEASFTVDTSYNVSSLDTGASNFGNYPIYIGARAGTSLFYSGNIYQIVFLNKLLSAAELVNLQYYVATKCSVAAPGTVPNTGPFYQTGPTLDLVFAGQPTDGFVSSLDSIDLNFIAGTYQVGAQYMVWE